MKSYTDIILLLAFKQDLISLHIYSIRLLVGLVYETSDSLQDLCRNVIASIV